VGLEASVTLRIELPPDVAAKYAAEASVRGVPLERYVRDRLIAQAPAPLDMTPQERARALREWAKSHRATPPLSDDAVRRESIYGERG
jgi:hypothetical protein